MRARQGFVRFGLVGLAAATVVAVVAGCGSGGGNEATGAGSDWSTNGGDMSNQRYSTLDDIDTSNVAQLKGVWRTHLNGSGVAAKYSGESQPIVQDGVIYITTGNDDVFAVSVDSGKILWEHKSNISQEISTICCGWLNRGVAIGDGRLYLGQLDGKVVALDPDTGGTLWTRQLVQWQQGQVITGAPLFLDGKIYIGVVGADYGTRGFLEAIDAETGDSVWRAYMVPGPGEPGSETWPQNSPAYLPRRRLDLVDPRVRRGPEPPLRHDGQCRQRLVRRRPRGRQPLRGVDRRDRQGLREDQMAASRRSTTTSGTTTRLLRRSCSTSRTTATR